MNEKRERKKNLGDDDHRLYDAAHFYDLMISILITINRFDLDKFSFRWDKTWHPCENDLFVSDDNENCRQ